MATPEKKNVEMELPPARKESEMERPGLQKYALGGGPWTDKDEEWFQFMVSEFGGAPDVE